MAGTKNIIFKVIICIVIFALIIPLVFVNLNFAFLIFLDKKSQRSIAAQSLTEWYSDDLNIHLYSDIGRFIYGDINLDGEKVPIYAYIRRNSNNLTINYLENIDDGDDFTYIATYRCDFRNKDYFKATLTDGEESGLKKHIVFYKTSENVFQEQLVKETAEN